MDNDKCQDGNNISPIMTLPEETMRKIFNYLSFETLFFSLRRVCKNIQTYVDRYLKVRGTSLLIGYQEGTEKEVIEIMKDPEDRLGDYISLRAPESSIPWVTSTSKLNNGVRLDDYRDRRIDTGFYTATHEKGVRYIYKSEKNLIIRYDLENEVWERLLENCTVKYLDSYETSHEFIPRLVSDLIPYWYPYFFKIDSYSHNHHPFLQVKAKDEPWIIGKIISCKRLR